MNVVVLCTGVMDWLIAFDHPMIANGIWYLYWSEINLLQIQVKG
jgi:hypothetical protein